MQIQPLPGRRPPLAGPNLAASAAARARQLAQLAALLPIADSGLEQAAAAALRDDPQLVHLEAFCLQQSQPAAALPLLQGLAELLGRRGGAARAAALWDFAARQWQVRGEAARAAQALGQAGLALQQARPVDLGGVIDRLSAALRQQPGQAEWLLRRAEAIWQHAQGGGTQRRWPPQSYRVAARADVLGSLAVRETSEAYALLAELLWQDEAYEASGYAQRLVSLTPQGATAKLWQEWTDEAPHRLELQTPAQLPAVLAATWQRRAGAAASLAQPPPFLLGSPPSPSGLRP